MQRLFTERMKKKYQERERKIIVRALKNREEGLKYVSGLDYFSKKLIVISAYVLSCTSEESVFRAWGIQY